MIIWLTFLILASLLVGTISINILHLRFKDYIKEVAKLVQSKATAQVKKECGTVAKMATYIQEQADFIKGICLLFSLSFFFPYTRTIKNETHITTTVTEELSQTETFCDMTEHVITYFLHNGKMVRFIGSAQLIQGLFLVYLNLGDLP